MKKFFAIALLLGGISLVGNGSVGILVVSLMLSGLITGGVRCQCVAGACRLPRCACGIQMELGAPRDRWGKTQQSLSRTGVTLR